MGMYVAVRGWLEFDHGQREQVERTLAEHRDDQYAGGWAFPARPFNSTLYVFYGGDIREQAVASFREQVAELARLNPVDDDLDRPVGFFLLSDERQGSTSWTIRDGEVADTVAPADLRWFAERP
ncbi:hypothetical protein [Amycolatopsis sp. NBC_01286]|uniref:hypothetical protein n=1 Tax=Amycolatopsis sp. NBC_01286 TaxID=2903560 RepID=UPI002E158083|nr:hypothetical protein OG570_22370 [Amycolatopsis sp. NBC_01286]